MTIFSTRSFVEMAVKDEISGEAFYRTRAEITKDSKLKEIYNTIADQEKVHAANFKNIAESLPKEAKREEYSGQFEQYIDTLLANRAFPDANGAITAAKSMKTDLEAVNKALAMEKDTLLFYYEIKEFIPSNNKAVLDKIIHEEQVHVQELTEIKETLS